MMSVIDGTIAAETLNGGDDADVLRGLDGDDRLIGWGGNDTVVGGEGDDVLTGNNEADLVRGEEGADTVYGNDGNDTVEGGEGADNLGGGSGDDIVRGDAGDDVVEEYAYGNDQYSGEAGEDRFLLRDTFNTSTLLVDGGQDDDRLTYSRWGGVSAATLAGGEGDDSITAFEAVLGASIDGGAGDDQVWLLAGGTGNVVTLGPGRDSLRLAFSASGQALAEVKDFETGSEGDRIDLDASFGPFSENPFGSGLLKLVQDEADTLLQLRTPSGAYADLLRLVGVSKASLTATNLGGAPQDGGPALGMTLTGDDGDDSIRGGLGADTLTGLGGLDSLSGGSLDDVLLGGAGDDSLQGGPGDDTLRGGADNDILDGGLGADVVRGDGGGDRIWVGSGAVSVDGGEGNDVLVTSEGGLSADALVKGGDGDDYFRSYHQGSGLVDLGAGDDVFEILRSPVDVRIALGTGSDRVEFSPHWGAAGATIVDFQTGDAGDRLNLVPYIEYGIEPYDDNPFSLEVLRLVQEGEDTLVQHKRPYSNSWYTLITLESVRATDLTAYNLGGFPADGSTPPGASVVGGAGADWLEGTVGTDHLSGGEGNDHLQGHRYEDTLDGGAGDDSLYGGTRSDSLMGGDGNDLIVDEHGSDGMYGEDGDDRLSFWDRDSRGSGGPSWAVTMSGGAGKDQLSLTMYADDIATVIGGAGDDLIIVRDGGTALIHAAGGDDILRLENLFPSARVVAQFGRGTDTLDFTSGFATIPTADNIVIRDFKPGDGGDKIQWYGALTERLAGWDKSTNPFSTGHLRLLEAERGVLVQLDRDGSGSAAEFATVVRLRGVKASELTAFNLGGFPADGSAAPGQDVTGSSAADTLFGSMGTDLIDGEDGGDVLYGNAGNDTLEGGGGADTLHGGYGADLAYGGDGDDRINAFEGGADTSWGGAGNDEINFQDRGTGRAEHRAGYGGAGHDSLGFFNLVIGSNETPTAHTALLAGGEGDDSISGNNLYGSTTLVGGEGDDRLIVYSSDGTYEVRLGLGQDTLELRGWFGAEVTITDFEAGDAGDRFALRSFITPMLGWGNSTANPFETGHLALDQGQRGTRLLIDSDGTSGPAAQVVLLTLRGVDADDLTADNLDGYDPLAGSAGAADSAFVV